MCPKAKKILLQAELAQIELTEAEHLFTQYNKEFTKEFGNELRYLDSKSKSDCSIADQKQQKKTLSSDDEASPSVLALVQNIYRNLAKKLHPDVSHNTNADSLFKRLTSLYENCDVIGIISLAAETQIELPLFQEEEYNLIKEEIKCCHKKATNISQRLAWKWQESKNDPKIKEVIYNILGIDLSEFTSWNTGDQ